MLEVGNGGMTDAEYRSHFSLWAMLAAPLIAGNDVRAMSPATAEILMNKEVIAIDQDPLGIEGQRVTTALPGRLLPEGTTAAVNAASGDAAKNAEPAHPEIETEVWSRPLADGSRAVILFNRSKTQQTIKTDWPQIGYTAHQSAAVRDLWQHKDLGNFIGSFSSPVPPHGVVMVKITP
jgi:alpha-galactosidase